MEGTSVCVCAHTRAHTHSYYFHTITPASGAASGACQQTVQTGGDVVVTQA